MRFQAPIEIVVGQLDRADARGLDARRELHVALLEDEPRELLSARRAGGIQPQDDIRGGTAATSARPTRAVPA